MTKFHRLSFLTTICFLALLIFVSRGNALFDSNLDKAKEFMQAGMYPQAIALLEKEINDNPTNAEAHFQLGICYINQNNYNSADERFASAVRLKPDYGYKIGKEFKKAADAALKKGSLSTASTLFDKAIIYDPNFKKQGYDFFMTLGDRSKSALYYERALQYAQGDKEKQKRIGFKFLKLAVKEWPGSRCESLKQKAVMLVGQDIINEVFPPPTKKILFEKTYSETDADENGWISTFKWGDIGIQNDDLLEVIGEISGGEKIKKGWLSYYRGDKFKPHWEDIVNGYFAQKGGRTPNPNSYFSVWVEKGKGISFTVRISREVTYSPRKELLE